jgi:type I restriction enzyme, S subunit
MSLVTPKKGYKLVPWLFGKEIEIPQEWDRGLFGNIFNFVKGKLPKEVFDEDASDRLPYLTSQGLAEKYDQFVHESDGVLVNESDIIMITDGEGSGRSYTSKKGILTSTFLAFTRKSNLKINNKFVFYYLKHNYPFLKQTRYGTGIPHTDKFVLKNLPVPMPTIEEEQKIANILSNVDNLIETTVQVIEKSKQVKIGLIQKLLTRGIGHTKFKKVPWFFGKVIEIPQEWSLEPLEEQCKKITDGTHQSPKFEESGIPFLFVSNIITGKLNLTTKKFISNKTFKELTKNTKIEFGDILLSTVGSFGVAVNVDILEEFCFQRHIGHLKPITSKIHFKFLKDLLNSSLVQSQLIFIAEGIAQKTLTLSGIKKIVIPLPPLPEQQKIATILSNVDSKITSQEQYKKKLEKLKKSLMQKLLTGEVRV